MLALYILCAAFGVPLVLWFAFAGDTDGGFDVDAGDVGDLGDVGDAGGHGQPSGIRFPLPLGSLAFGIAGFGLTGVLAQLVAGGGAATLVAALIVGVLAGGFYGVLLRLVKRSQSSSSVTDRELQGQIGKVVLPIPEGGRGQISLNAGGQQLYFTAVAHDAAEIPELGQNAAVVVVGIVDGVARVTPAGPALDA